MGLWSYYFFAKFFLYIGQYIDFDALMNLAFALLLLIPLRRRWQIIGRQIIAVPLGIALLYHDSWLPPVERLLSQTSNLQQFNALYLLELLGRFVNPIVVAYLLGMVLVLAILSRKLRLSGFVVLGILLIAGNTFIGKMRSGIPTEVLNAGPVPISRVIPTDPALSERLQSFYLTEAQRRTHFARPASSTQAFDIVYLHICSLAWDDMALVNEMNHPLMGKFNVIFKQFNSAATYSGPAAIRLLRGDCGQPPHDELYKPAPAECNVLGNLQQAGFQPEWLMNHDGHFGNFTADVGQHGGLAIKMDDNTQAKVGMLAFDDTPVYDDADVLGQWVKKRAQNKSNQVALYYNTISLHDGNYIPNVAKPSTNKAYQQRLKKLFDDFDGFFNQLSTSGRKTVVIMVPEHGAALRGDRMQITGLREIPTPAITLVPAAIKLIGFSESSKPILIDQPMSYLGLNSLISNFVAQSPFDSSHPSLEEYVADLPQTDFVSENEGMVMMRLNGRDMLRNPDLSWSEYLSGPR